jgi:hypothetical protein
MVGQQMGRVFQRVIFHSGMTMDFEIISYPKDEYYMIKVFGRDEIGDTYDDRGRKGFEHVRVCVVYPHIFVSVFEYGEEVDGSKSFTGYPEASEYTKALLEKTICDYCIKKGICKVI